MNEHHCGKLNEFTRSIKITERVDAPPIIVTIMLRKDHETERVCACRCVHDDISWICAARCKCVSHINTQAHLLALYESHAYIPLIG